MYRGSIHIFMFDSLHNSLQTKSSFHTVDGRNPASPCLVETHGVNHLNELVQDFFHPTSDSQCHLSSLHVANGLKKAPPFIWVNYNDFNQRPKPIDNGK